MKNYTVELTHSAESDLAGIYRFIAQHDSPESAEKLFDKLSAACEKLSNFPGRGRRVLEFKSLLLDEYLESFSGPYRIIYTIKKHEVNVIGIFDGRRNLPELIYRRAMAELPDEVTF